MANRILRAARRMLEDSEPWMVPHQDAMRRFDYRDQLQEWIAYLNGAFHYIQSIVSSWQTGVRDGTINFDEEQEKQYLDTLREWLDYSEKALAALKHFLGEEREELKVSGAEEFQGHRQWAQEFLQEAERLAAVEARVGYREVRGDAADLKNALQSHAP